MTQINLSNSSIHNKISPRLIVQNLMSMGLASLISQVILAVTGIVIVRYLGNELYSQYSAAMLFMGMFSIFGQLGFNRVFLRDCSKDISKTSGYYFATFLLSSCFVVISFTVALLIAWQRYDQQTFYLTIILGSSQLLMVLRRTPTTVFQVNHRQYITAIVTTIATLVYLVSIIICLYFKQSVFVIAGLHLGMNLVNFVLSYMISFRYALPKFNKEILLYVFTTGRRFFAIDIMLVVYSRINGFILAFFNQQNEVGVYNAPFRLFNMVQMIAQLADSVLSPILYKSATSVNTLISNLKNVIRYFTITGIFFCVVIFSKSEWLILTLFKEDFVDSIVVLRILSLTIVSRFIVIVFSHVIYALNNEKFMFKLMLSVAILTTSCAILMIKYFGAFGASIVLFTGETILAVVCILKSEQLLGYPMIWKSFIKPLISAIVTWQLMLQLDSYPVTSIVLSPLFFYLTLFLMQYYRLQELKDIIHVVVEKK